MVVVLQMTLALQINREITYDPDNESRSPDGQGP